MLPVLFFGGALYGVAKESSENEEDILYALKKMKAGHSENSQVVVVFQRTKDGSVNAAGVVFYGGPEKLTIRSLIFLRL